MKLPERIQGKIVIYIDMDDTICDYMKAHLEHYDYDFSPFPQARNGFYLGLDPLKGAIEGVKELLTMPEYDVYILTAPSVINAHSYTEKRLWIEKHFGLDFCHKLILSPNKGLLSGHYLIDDIVMGKGQENFRGELITYGSMRFPDWESIMEYFRKLHADNTSVNLYLGK